MSTLRAIPAALATHLAQPATTVCYLLKFKPVRAGVAVFGITTLDRDVTFDDGSGDGPIAYQAKRGYTPFDIDTKADLSVDSSEASGLLAEYPMDGVTPEGIARGDYDGARFIQYIVNYEDLTMGAGTLNAGQVGQIKILDDLSCQIELRSLTQILKQNSVVEVTSITCRAQFGDERCKMAIISEGAEVDTVGAEEDRVFTAASFATIYSGVSLGAGDGSTVAFALKDQRGAAVTSGYAITEVTVDGVATTAYTDSGTGTITFTTAPASGKPVAWSGGAALTPTADYYVPGVVTWLTGDNAGKQSEVEEFDYTTGEVTLVFPMPLPIQASDTFTIRPDCAKSKAACLAYGNYLNFRGEPELPRADGTDLQSPTTVASS